MVTPAESIDEALRRQGLIKRESDIFGKRTDVFQPGKNIPLGAKPGIYGGYAYGGSREDIAKGAGYADWGAYVRAQQAKAAGEEARILAAEREALAAEQKRLAAERAAKEEAAKRESARIASEKKAAEQAAVARKREQQWVRTKTGGVGYIREVPFTPTGTKYYYDTALGRDVSISEKDIIVKGSTYRDVMFFGGSTLMRSPSGFKAVSPKVTVPKVAVTEFYKPKFDPFVTFKAFGTNKMKAPKTVDVVGDFFGDIRKGIEFVYETVQPPAEYTYTDVYVVPMGKPTGKVTIEETKFKLKDGLFVPVTEIREVKAKEVFPQQMFLESRKIEGIDIAKKPLEPSSDLLAIAAQLAAQSEKHKEW